MVELLFDALSSVVLSGFLQDFSTVYSCCFYLVEVCLSPHSHILW